MQIEGINANADDAIMLDKDGYLSETNATNIVRSLFTRFTFMTPIYHVYNLKDVSLLFHSSLPPK